MPKKFEDCVKDVQKKGHDKSSAYAICTSSFKKAGEPYKEKKSKSILAARTVKALRSFLLANHENLGDYVVFNARSVDAESLKSVSYFDLTNRDYKFVAIKKSLLSTDDEGRIVIKGMYDVNNVLKDFNNPCAEGYRRSDVILKDGRQIKGCVPDKEHDIKSESEELEPPTHEGVTTPQKPSPYHKAPPIKHG